MPQPIEYELKIWLACGITTIRDVGSDTRKALALARREREGHARRAAHLHLSAVRPSDERRLGARPRARAQGDGRRTASRSSASIATSCRRWRTRRTRQGLRIAHHVGVEETNAWDDIHFGTTSIEHWYGIPDAAIADGVQDFPVVLQLQQRDRSLSLGRPPLARGRPGAAARWCSTRWSRATSRGCRRSTSTRRRAICSARRRSRGSATICIPRSRNTSAPIRRITARTSSAGRRPTRRSGRRTTGSG